MIVDVVAVAVSAAAVLFLVFTVDDGGDGTVGVNGTADDNGQDMS